MSHFYIYRPQVSLATAHVLLHRFYCKCSLTENNIRIAALTTLGLATKLEEAHVGTVILLQVYDRVTKRQNEHARQLAMSDGPPPPPPGPAVAATASAPTHQQQIPPVLDPNSMRYCELHARMIHMERTVLESLGFICHVEHPHKLVIYITRVILSCDKELCQVAWGLCNDRYVSIHT